MKKKHKKRGKQNDSINTKNQPNKEPQKSRTNDYMNADIQAKYELIKIELKDKQKSRSPNIMAG